MATPNVLFLLTDQWRGDCLGADGNDHILTPVMDGLAAEGVRFSHAYSTCPVCVPARRSILSGQYPEHHGADFNSAQEWNPRCTLPQSLRDAGYHTYFVGRDMHQYPEGKRFGYDHYLTSREYQRWVAGKIQTDCTATDSWLDGYTYTNGPVHNSWVARPWIYNEEWHQTNWIVNEGFRFLNRLRDPTCPYFLTLSFLAPHPPLTPPAFYYERYHRMDNAYTPALGSWETPPSDTDSRTTSGWHVRLEGEALRSCVAGYYGSINHIDDQLQRILCDILVDLRDTIVVFTSDHGEMLGDHYMWKKSRPYEGACRVPLLIRFPERFGIPAGTVIDAPVCLEDIYPTLLDACGLSIPSDVDGCSLLPLCRGEISSVREYVHIRHRSFYPQLEGFHALTDGRRKFIWYFDEAVNRLQYFDLERDPRECTDRIADPAYREEIAAWRKALVKELTKTNPELIQEGDLRPLPGADRPITF